MSGRHDIEIEQGATWSRTITWSDAAGAPINLAGYTARMMVRADYTSALPLVSLTSGAGGITINAAAGQVTVTITAAQSATLPAGRHVYDLELVQGAYVKRLLEGRARVTPEATK